MTRKQVLWIAILLAGLTLLACVGSGGTAVLPVGEKAPDFGVRTGSVTFTLADLNGRVVVVNFWSST